MHAVLNCFVEGESEVDIKKNIFNFKKMMIEFFILSKNTSKDKVKLQFNIIIMII